MCIMARKRKLYIENTPIFLTSRVEENLPFIPCYLINAGLKGILARALTLYNITLCHYVFMTNHFHMIAVVRNPEHVSAFMKYVKQESAAMINRFCGVRKHTLWEEGFDDPIFLSPDKVIEKIKYLYSNPVKAHLVKSIAEYPGISSWHAFKCGNFSETCSWLSRSNFEKVDNLHLLSENRQRMLFQNWLNETVTPHEYNLVIEPNAWMECFAELRHNNAEEINQQLIQNILTEELNIHHKMGVLGVTRLCKQVMNKVYKSTKYSPRMICLCSDIVYRANYISFFKKLSKKAVEAYKLIKQGVCEVIFPPGMFLAGGRLLVPIDRNILATL